MGVAEPLRRPTASRGRKRPRAAARLVGTSRAACCRPRLRVNPFLVWFVSFWLLFSGVWETLIFGTGDWFAFGEPFFCGLFTPTYPLPGHRLVPESHIVNVSSCCCCECLQKCLVADVTLHVEVHPCTHDPFCNDLETSSQSIISWLPPETSEKQHKSLDLPVCEYPFGPLPEPPLLFLCPCLSI